MKKTLIFDFDGTLVNSKDVIIQIYNEIAQENNYKKISSSDVSNLSRISIAERCKLLSVPTYKIPLLFVEAMKRYKDHIININISEELLDVLIALKEEFNLSIISSNSESTIGDILKNNKIDIFNSIHSSKNLFGKHFAINAYIRKFKLSKDNVIYIGDELRDIVSCKKCGVRVIAVTWGYDSADLLKSYAPDYLVNTPMEIAEIVKNI